MNIVPPQGSPYSKLWIVGEAPGAEEERQGMPFCGKSGQFLNGALSRAGINRAKCYVTNVSLVRPPANEWHRLHETGTSEEEQVERLLKEVETFKPKVIIALGDKALSALTGREGITENRGIAVKVGQSLVIPSFHPAYILRLGDKTSKKEREGKGKLNVTYGIAKITLVLDLKKAMRLLEGSGDYDAVPVFVGINESPPDVEDALNNLRNVPTAVDIETNKEGCITWIGFGSKDFGLSLRFGEYRGMIKDFLEHHPSLIVHNGSFDIPILRKHDIDVRVKYDTLLAHHWLYPELPHDLDYLSTIYFNFPTKMHPEEWTDEIEYYNALHAHCTARLESVLSKEMEELGIREKFDEFVMPLSELLMEMSERGVRVDMEALKQVKDDLERQLKEAYDEFNQIAPDVNPRSPKQVAELLYEKLGLPKQVNKDTGKLTTDAAALEKLAKKTKNRAIELLLKIRELEKMKGTYADVEIDSDGRIRTSYNVAGTETGRLSSRRTNWGTGTNLQNIPTWFRRVFVPDEGKVFVEADLEQAEARIVAYLAGDEGMMNVFESGQDIHRWNASRLFGKAESEVTNEERYLAKRIVHAFDYGLGPIHAAEIIGCTIAQAKKHKQNYFKAFPKVVAWQQAIACGPRILVTPMGRRRQFFGRDNEDLVRKMLAYIPQSTCVDYLNHGMLRLWKMLPAGAELLLQNHDGFLLQCKQEQVEEVKRLIKDCIEVPITINNRQMIIPVKIKTSTTNWEDVK